MSAPLCSHCAVGSLSTFFESRLGLCTDCCALFVDIARKWQVDGPKIQGELTQAKDFITAMTDSYTAEKLGLEAARKGFEADQNPYVEPARPAVRAAWNFGWSRGQLERRTAQAIAVIEWAMPVLEMIEEIALGADADEIAAKVKLVKEKLGQFV